MKKPRRNQKKTKKSRSWNRMPRPSDYLSQGLDLFDFLMFFDFLEVFHFSRSESRKVNKPRRNQKNTKKSKNQGPGTECPDPVTISLKALIFFTFSRFLTFSDSDLGILSQDFLDFFEVFAASWVSCPSPLSIFLAVLELWRTELQCCSPAKSVLQPRPAVLELLLEMPPLPIVWQPCQGSREACSVETLAGEALKSCSGLSVQLLPSGLQF